ncbi:MAG: HAMP domain-containing protein, partial [Tepidimonas sp.]|uniref:HAMP domain-containing protein n=1 Tax=Tepidimonas sp. TaxID=2002775 RepID=UPI004054F077
DETGLAGTWAPLYDGVLSLLRDNKLAPPARHAQVTQWLQRLQRLSSAAGEGSGLSLDADPIVVHQVALATDLLPLARETVSFVGGRASVQLAAPDAMTDSIIISDIVRLANEASRVQALLPTMQERLDSLQRRGNPPEWTAFRKATDEWLRSVNCPVGAGIRDVAFYRATVGGLRHLNQAIEHAAKGDLTSDAVLPGSDEMADMNQRLRNMLSSLSELVADVRSAAAVPSKVAAAAPTAARCAPVGRHRASSTDRLGHRGDTRCASAAQCKACDLPPRACREDRRHHTLCRSHAA